VVASWDSTKGSTVVVPPSSARSVLRRSSLRRHDQLARAGRWDRSECDSRGGEHTAVYDVALGDSLAAGTGASVPQTTT